MPRRCTAHYFSQYLGDILYIPQRRHDRLLRFRFHCILPGPAWQFYRARAYGRSHRRPRRFHAMPPGMRADFAAAMSRRSQCLWTARYAHFDEPGWLRY